MSIRALVAALPAMVRTASTVGRAMAVRLTIWAAETPSRASCSIASRSSACAHRGAVDVLDELVDHPVGLLGTGDDVHRDQPVGGADLGGGQGAPLPPVDHEVAVVVDPHGDGLQDAARLDGRGELARAGVGVGADVGADGQGLRGDPVGFPDPVGGAVGGAHC